ncbi:hypothetical protein AMK59_4501 [Oryctes borbonicus]|uniref:BZIP domain-containing protein n=1 Tax=Oryctes borbonicus TaxID=1629725 RepID=A0A0T6B8T7_9SCAR|nr:hypothetical protein AMK59_4501 [Oryctes borbonicus]
MSHLLDYLCKPSVEEDFHKFMEFQEEMNNLDIPLQFDSSELMSSDFFDSVLSMERENINGALGHDLLNNTCAETIFSEGSSGHTDEIDVYSPSTTMSPDNDSLILGQECNNLILKNEDILEQVDLNINQGIINFEEQVVQENNTQPTKIVVQNANKHFILTKPLISTGKKLAKNTKQQQLIRVQPISGNGRSLLLPVNVKNVKKIKIINANDLKMENIKVTTPIGNIPLMKQATIDKYASSDSNADEDIDMESSSDSRYPPLNLTSEEKRLLSKEGIKLPSHYPLTKHEEKELKRIRRKIRNKISAQDSRKRKKEYVDKLEEKAKRTSEENEFLKKRIKLLRKQNGRLMEQMRKLQTLLFNTSSSKATPTTCLMIVLFSTLLVCLPNLRLSENKELGEQQLFAARRALLFNQKASEDDNTNVDEFLVFNKDEESELELFEDESENATDSEFTSFLSELAKKYESLPMDKNCSEVHDGQGSLGEFCRKYEEDIKKVISSMKEYLEKDPGKEKAFIEPDISDDEEFTSIKEEPPLKRIKVDMPDVAYELSKTDHTNKEDTKQYVVTQ